MRLSIIIPAHNEEEVIAHTIEDIKQAIPFDNYEIIVVNDHSSDNTKKIIMKAAQSCPELKIVDNNMGRGFADALRMGISVASGELLIPVMADLCDDLNDIKVMVERAEDGYDIICGSRYMPKGKKINGPMIQNFFSRFVGISLGAIIRIPTHDISNSYKCYRRRLLEGLQTRTWSFAFSMEITLCAYFIGAKITEIPTSWRGRSMGKSKFYIFKVAPDYIRLYIWAIIRSLKLVR